MSRPLRPWAACVPAALMVSWCGACTPRQPPAVSLPGPSVITVTSMRAQEDRIRSMRARFSATTAYGGEERSADGVLLVVKPDRFRLRLFLPLGLTVFDYLDRGDRTWITMPMRSEREGPPPEDLAVFSREDLGQAFLRGDYTFPGRCDASAAADEVVITCREAQQVVREIRVAAATGTISQETSYADGAPRMVLRYSDYRAVDSQALPFRISMLYPAKGMSVDITIWRYELNPHLADALFQPPEEH